MKKKLFIISLSFIILIIIATICIILYEYNINSNSNKLNQIVNINEIKQLYKNGDASLASMKLDELELYLRETDSNYNYSSIILASSLSIIFVILVFIYIYFKILRPFDKLENFASEISRGNFDIPLNYERNNFFGKFTWAFDSMRKEITKARNCEKEAIVNNKTVIASLSHDIKTPIASIKAYSEALEANMDNTYEAREEFVSVIIRKADEVKKLTDDLFLHSVSDMDRISINNDCVDLNDIIKTSSKDFQANQTINYSEYNNAANVNGDRDRILQVFENIINNSIKYANTKIDINLNENDEYYIAIFRDYGPGISNKDIPFIYEKFYRGDNSIGRQGTGLGLYIVKYMMEKMNGKVEIENNNGLIVKLFFKKCIS